MSHSFDSRGKLEGRSLTARSSVEEPCGQPGWTVCFMCRRPAFDDEPLVECVGCGFLHCPYHVVMNHLTGSAGWLCYHCDDESYSMSSDAGLRTIPASPISCISSGALGIDGSTSSRELTVEHFMSYSSNDRFPEATPPEYQATIPITEELLNSWNALHVPYEVTPMWCGVSGNSAFVVDLCDVSTLQHGYPATVAAHCVRQMHSIVCITMFSMRNMFNYCILFCTLCFSMQNKPYWLCCVPSWSVYCSRF